MKLGRTLMPEPLIAMTQGDAAVPLPLRSWSFVGETIKPIYTNESER